MIETVQFREAARAHISLLAACEKRCLVWLAGRMPARVNSDHLTLLGFLAMFGVGASFALARFHPAGLVAAAAFLALNWFGDSLDGTLARVRSRLRPKYGFYVDHVVDTFGAFFVLGGLGISGYMSPAIAAGLLIAYFMLTIEIYLATYALGVFHLSFWKFGPTELRILLAAGSLALLWRPRVNFAGGNYLLFDLGGFFGIVGLAAVLIISAIRHTRELSRAEPPITPRA